MISEESVLPVAFVVVVVWNTKVHYWTKSISNANHFEQKTFSLSSLAISQRPTRLTRIHSRDSSYTWLEQHRLDEFEVADGISQSSLEKRGNSEANWVVLLGIQFNKLQLLNWFFKRLQRVSRTLRAVLFKFLSFLSSKQWRFIKWGFIKCNPSNRKKVKSVFA